MKRAVDIAQAAAILYRSGLPVREIARLLGVSWKTAAKAVELETERQKLRSVPQALWDQAVALYQSGMTMEAVGEQLGLTSTQVSKAVQRAGIKARPRSPEAAHGGRIRYRKGCRCDECVEGNRAFWKRHNARKKKPSAE